MSLLNLLYGAWSHKMEVHRDVVWYGLKGHSRCVYFCLSGFFCDSDKIRLKKRQLKGEKVYSVSQFKYPVHPGRRVRVAGA